MRNPPRRAARKATFAYPGAVARRVAWGRALQLAAGWRVVDVRGTPRIVDPMGWRVLDLPGDGWEGRGGYTVRPAQIRALSPACRDWFKATARNVAASNARIKAATTVRTIAELNPTIAAREARLRKWATGGARRLETPAPWNPSGATAASPDHGAFAWRFVGAQSPCGYARRMVACGCVISASLDVRAEDHECEALAYSRPYPPRADWFRDRLIARHLPHMARVQIRRAA